MNRLIKSVAVDAQSNSIVVDLGFCRVYVPLAAYTLLTIS